MKGDVGEPATSASFSGAAASGSPSVRVSCTIIMVLIITMLLSPSCMLAANHSLAASSDLVPVQGATSGKVKSLQDYDSYPRQFVVRRLVVFVGIVIGYAQLLPMCCRAHCA